ncbi:hypothetical protein K7X08_006192 [Anisodus acutangulus]|uniref:Uncharacterized protein n=1 Tax=Anisodus acutangulus TaxID=402998 RepID=A0A9Q1MYD7_9SOLA|nr:hypothetical protein K7X08_006192 [Anisodus acutangulus]
MLWKGKMVASLIASGASAGAVTDPSSRDPVGKTAASIASSCGHKGLAGYLSEVALTSHLSSLTVEESELSKGTADVEAEKTISSISNTRSTINEDQRSLKDTLAAVRNAAQAAARIQSAFRAHSFRKRQQRESVVSATASGDEYAVKIQAHVRGYQVRKQYKVCWAVGILEKVLLRWRRRGVGLRGFRHDTESIDESEDEDILKLFRKQKVDAALDEAVLRVLSMVESPGARKQYYRILEKYRQAKADLEGADSETASTAHADMSNMENDDIRRRTPPPSPIPISCNSPSFFDQGINYSETWARKRKQLIVALTRDTPKMLERDWLERGVQPQLLEKLYYSDSLLLDSLKEETPLDQMNQSTNMQETPSVNKVEEAEDDEVNREKEKVVKELKKIQKQNFITQCLLSAMIVLTVTWQLSEVSLILKMKDGLNHPLRSIGSMITGWIKRPPRGLNGKEGDSAKQLKHQVEAMCHSKIKVPELPHMEMLSLDFINEED